MTYQITISESALADIAYFKTHEQRTIVAGIMSHLRVDAETPSRKLKQLRPNLIAPWELRLGKYRVFYSVDASGNVRVVNVAAVGYKDHNELFIRGKKVSL